MSAPKPGTRCECRDATCDCAHEHRATPEAAHADCQREAVRMVAMRFGVPGNYPLQKVIPMCESCAQYHEAKAGQP